MSNQPQPGWYPDPHDPSRSRYWDGAAWTEQSMAAEELASSTQPLPKMTPPPSIPTPSTPPSKAWWKRRWVQITAAAVVGFFAIGGIASALSPQTDAAKQGAGSTPASSVGSQPAPDKTVTVTATPKPTKTAAPSKAAAKPAKPSSAAPSRTAPSSPVATSWTLPNETGKTLQAAQDDIQTVSGNPLFFTTSSDASGADRMQLWDRDWQVCSQTPAAGTRFTEDTDIDFSVVKLGEACP